MQIVAPAAEENLPFTHASQATLPVTDLDVPAMHRQQLPAVPLYPVLHTQLVIPMLASGEVVAKGSPDRWQSCFAL